MKILSKIKDIKEEEVTWAHVDFLKSYPRN